MKNFLLIGTGSFIGGVFRYALGRFIQSKIPSTFPFATLGINLAGCFTIGIIFGLSERTSMSAEWRLFFAAGICGGFTTFSAFSGDILSLLRDGHLWNAAAYILSSVVLGVLATFLGYSLFKFV